MIQKCLIFLIFSLYSIVQCQAQVPTFNEPIVLGYFPSWSESWTSTGQNSKLREIPNHVNYVFLAFAKPDLTYVQGSYDLSGTGIQVPYDGCTLKESVGALKNKGTEVILSIGGETYWTSNTIYDNINYNQIKDLVDDMGFAGIDWDFEPNGSFAEIGSATNVQHFIDFFTNSRAIMPRSEGYIMACAPSGVGALGGQTNDDSASPFAYANRNSLTGETDANLYNFTTPTNGISLFGFSATGHMIPVMQAVGDEIDIIAFQGYNVGASTNRLIMYDAYAHYAEQYGFKIAAGVHYPDEPWGPYYEYTNNNVAAFSEHIETHPDRIGDKDGIMIWQLLLEDGNGSAYAYLNVGSQVLNGTDEATAVANANNFSLAPYSGGADECTTGGGGSGTYCGAAEYNNENSYPNPGMQVHANCKIWENQWWANPNEAPGSNAVWLEIMDCTEAPGCGSSYDDILNTSNVPPCLTQDEIYVDYTASGLNDGTSWANAFTDLQMAISNASSGNCSAIYIAEGTYTPTTTSSRGIFFSLEKNLNIYGGFPNGGGDADAELYPTILSGDIDNDGTLEGNSFHVVQVKGGATVSLYHLNIQDGYADNANSFARARGAGIFVNNANLNLVHCNITNNKAIYGGGIFATLSQQTFLLNTLIESNEAGNGSAIYHSNETNLYLVRSRILNNNSTIRCAVEVNNSLYTYIENSIIANNPSANANALGLIATNRNQTCDIYNSTILGESKNKYLITLQIGFGDELTFNINNSIVAHQHSNFDKNVKAFNNNLLHFNHHNCYFQGAAVIGTGTNALFSDTAGGLLLNADYSTEACSPIVNAGDNTRINNFFTDTDINGLSRIYDNGTVDIGAYENQETCSAPRFSNDDHQLISHYSVYPNPTKGLVYISSDSDDISVALYDMLGREVMITNYNRGILDMTQLPEGTYLIHIYDAGQFLGVEKLVKY